MEVDSTKSAKDKALSSLGALGGLVAFGMTAGVILSNLPDMGNY